MFPRNLITDSTGNFYIEMVEIHREACRQRCSCSPRRVCPFGAEYPWLASLRGWRSIPQVNSRLLDAEKHPNQLTVVPPDHVTTYTVPIGLPPSSLRPDQDAFPAGARKFAGH